MPARDQRPTSLNRSHDHASPFRPWSAAIDMATSLNAAGISITIGDPGLGDREAVQAVIERARVAAAADLDHLSLGDHHATGDFLPYVQNVPTVGRIMADWPSNKPIGLLVLLPLWNPVLAAEQIGTLAAMSDVPFIVQTGIGDGAQQFDSDGCSLKTRGRATDAAIDVIKRLFAGETVDVARARDQRRHDPSAATRSPSSGGSVPARRRWRSSGLPAKATPGTSRPGWTGAVAAAAESTGRRAADTARRPGSHFAATCWSATTTWQRLGRHDR